MAPTVYMSEMTSNPTRSQLYPENLDVMRGGGPRIRRRPHRLPRGTKDRRIRGSVWLRSPLMGLTAEDTRQQTMSREDEEAKISTHSISSSIDSSNEDSDNSVYRGGSTGDESSMDCSSLSSASSSDRDERVWSREDMLKHQQQQQCQQLLLLKRREGLLDITMRTVNLMRRNQQLQYRLAALQAETRAFVRSVLSNPENQAIRDLTSRSRRKASFESEGDDRSIKKMKSDECSIRINTNTTSTVAAITAPIVSTTVSTPTIMREPDSNSDK